MLYPKMARFIGNITINHRIFGVHLLMSVMIRKEEIGSGRNQFKLLDVGQIGQLTLRFHPRTGRGPLTVRNSTCAAKFPFDLPLKLGTTHDSAVCSGSHPVYMVNISQNALGPSWAAFSSGYLSAITHHSNILLIS